LIQIISILIIKKRSKTNKKNKKIEREIKIMTASGLTINITTAPHILAWMNDGKTSAATGVILFLIL